MGVAQNSLMRPASGMVAFSGDMLIRLCRAGGLSVDAMLEVKLTSSGRCTSCGVWRSSPEGFMSRPLIGRERTAARKLVRLLAGSDPAEVARKLGMKRHSIATLLDGRRLPGRTFLESAARRGP